ncbi:TPA: restriction endonuclease subunit S [Bacillus paranthracis]
MSEWQKLKDVVVKIVGGGTPSRKKDEYYHGDIPWVTVKDLIATSISDAQEKITPQAIQESAANLIPKGNVIIATRMALGKAFINEVDVAINQDLKALIPNKDKIMPKYLLYTYLSNKEKIESLGSGTTVKGIRLEQVNGLEIFVPSLEEQKKIIAILSSVDDVIGKTEFIIEQIEKVKKGLIQQILTKGIGHTKFKKTEIGEIPLGWDVKELVELANSKDRYAFTGGPFGSNLKSSDYTEDGVRIIQLQNIKDGYFANDYKIYTSESKANELFSCNIYPGDIIMAKMAEPVARACIIPNYSDRYVMASDGIRLSVDKTKYITEYVTYAINAPYFRQQAVNNSTGTTRLRIGLSTLRRLKILVPSIEEQEKIADTLIEVDRKIEKEQLKVLKLKELKEGLMQSLLTGKVRVKADEAEVKQV